MDNIYKINNIDLKESERSIEFTKNEEGETCIKVFPVFENGRKIFKPLSTQKPYMTEFFAVSEVFSSRLAKFLNYACAQYDLAVCKGVNKRESKYIDKGVLTQNFLNKGEKFLSLLDYYEKHKAKNINFDEFINFAFCVYKLHELFDEEPFISNKELAKDLAKKMLFKYLIVDQNAHFGNLGFIKDKEGNLKSAPLFDNEYSHLFLLFNHMENRQSFYDLYMKYAQLNIDVIKQKFPDVVKEFKEQIFEIKNKQFLKDICNFSNLAKFIETYSWDKYTNFMKEKYEKVKVTKQWLEEKGELVYKDLNKHINRMLKI